MKALPLNKFTAAALIWFAAAIYALLFKEGGNSAPPFLFRTSRRRKPRIQDRRVQAPVHKHQDRVSTVES